MDERGGAEGEGDDGDGDGRRQAELDREEDEEETKCKAAIEVEKRVYKGSFQVLRTCTRTSSSGGKTLTGPSNVVTLWTLFPGALLVVPHQNALANKATTAKLFRRDRVLFFRVRLVKEILVRSSSASAVQHLATFPMPGLYLLPPHTGVEGA